MINYKNIKTQIAQDQVRKEAYVDLGGNLNDVEISGNEAQEICGRNDEFERILQNSENTYDHSNNLLYQYYAEVGKYPLLTPEEELYYGRLAQKEDVGAINKLMRGNLRLVIMFAQRYEYRGLELADLISEGNLGLRHAIGKYEPDLNFRFSTYAVWWIRYYIETAIMNYGRTIRIPIHINKSIAKLMKLARSLSQELQREATVAELAEASGLDVFEVMRLFSSNEASISLDGLLKGDDDDRDLYDVLPDNNSIDALAESLDSEIFTVLDNMVGSLTKSEQDVISYRFGVNGKKAKTLEATGEKMGITRDQVRYLQVKTLEKIRDLLELQEIELEDLLTS